MTSRPFNGLDVILNFGFLDAEFKDNRDAVTQSDFTGNTLPNSPKYTLNPSIRYSSELTKGLGGFAGILGHYAGKIYGNEANSFSQSSYKLVDVFVGVTRDITRAKELERTKDRFVSDMSHELRTPLGSVQNFLGMLNMGVLGEFPAKTARLAQSAERSVDRLIGLINELLDLEKMEQGKLHVEIGDTSLQEVSSIVKESIDGFANKHEVELIYPDNDLSFEADANKIAQVLIKRRGRHAAQRSKKADR